jgi:hypothetical protein
MNQEEFIRKLIDVEMAEYSEGAYADHGSARDQLELFARLITASEREACAQLADEQLMNTSALMSMPPKSSAAWNIAAAIRARKEST